MEIGGQQALNGRTSEFLLPSATEPLCLTPSLTGIGNAGGMLRPSSLTMTMRETGGRYVQSNSVRRLLPQAVARTAKCVQGDLVRNLGGVVCHPRCRWLR